MNKLTKRARIITGEVVLGGFRELARDDVLSRVDFDEVACQIFGDSASDILQEELSTREFFFSPEIDRYIAQVSKAIDGIGEDTRNALRSREGVRKVRDCPGIRPSVFTIARMLVGSQWLIAVP